MNEPFLTVTEIEDGKNLVKCKLQFEDPFAYGMVIVDMMRMIAMGYAKSEGATSSGPYLDRIKQGFEAEWEMMTTDVTISEKVGGTV